MLELFQEYEFRTLIAELEQQDSSADDMAGEYRVVTDKKEFLDWVTQLQSAQLFAFDTETTSLDYMSAEIVGISFAIEPGKAAYVPVAHDYLGAPDQLERSFVLATLKPLLEDPARQKVGQNLKYDQSVLARYHINMQGIAFDTMLESYCLNSVATRHNMDDLAEHYLNHKPSSMKTLPAKVPNSSHLIRLNWSRLAPMQLRMPI